MPITLAQAQEARRNIASVALRTPLIRCNGDESANLYLKLENLQPIGSFKIRGAANVMARTPHERLRRGVLTASAGNMAQGVAFCARRIGVSATIIAPDTAPATKIRAVERMGGRVIKVPFAEWWRTFETRSYPGIDATFIHAFDDPDVMAGNGTIALELLEDLPDVDAVVIPWGGGGLSCGIAAVLRELAPRVRIYAAEIETADIERTVPGGRHALRKTFIGNADRRGLGMRNAASGDAEHECQSDRAERMRATAVEQFSLCKRAWRNAVFLIHD